MFHEIKKWKNKILKVISNISWNQISVEEAHFKVDFTEKLCDYCINYTSKYQVNPQINWNAHLN